MKGVQPYLQVILKMIDFPGATAVLYVRPEALTSDQKQFLAASTAQRYSQAAGTAALQQADSVEVAGWFDRPMARAFANQLRPALVSAKTSAGQSLFDPTLDGVRE